MTEPHGPLVGLRVLVTRAHGESSEKLSHLLEEAGATPIEVPVIYFGEPASYDGLDNALRRLRTYNWVIFASAKAVSSVMARAERINVPFKNIPGSTRIAAIGRSTAEKLLSYGIETDYIPSAFVAESFLEEFPSINELASAKILWPRTNVGRTLIADALRERGAQVDTVEAYTTGLPPDAPLVARDIASKIDKGEIDIITLASAQTAKNLARLLTLEQEFDRGDGILNARERRSNSKLAEYFIHRLAGVKIATIGPITSEAAREHLRAPDIEASVFTAAGLVDALKRFFVAL
jgi:Uroporphyrinogen-III synthase